MFQVAKKGVLVTPPAASVNNGGITCNVIDTVPNFTGSEYLEIWILLGAMDAALTTVKLQESDVKASSTSLTGGTDISIANTTYNGSVVGTDPNDTGATSTLPTTAAASTIAVKFEIDLRGRKRYILPVITVGNGTNGAFVCVFAELSRGRFPATTAADKGVGQVMRG
jgi:hypothetical protein